MANAVRCTTISHNIRIQCMARSRTARKETLEQRKQARKREEASLKLQSFSRARVAVEEADQKRKKKEAAV